MRLLTTSAGGIRVDPECIVGSSGVVGTEPRNRLILFLLPPLLCTVDGGATTCHLTLWRAHAQKFAFAQRVDDVVEQTESGG